MVKNHELYTLRSGLVVIAKRHKGSVLPATYANRTQAERKAAELRSDGWPVADVYQIGRPFFVGVSK